jgi:hypothetical protein
MAKAGNVGRQPWKQGHHSSGGVDRSRTIAENQSAFAASAFCFSTGGFMDLIGKVCMVRTYSAGVFLGEVASKNGKEVHLKNARRMWYWDGAASLSQLAINGTSAPEKCKFPVPVPDVLLTEVIEIIPASEAAIESIKAVPVWEM